MTLPKDTSLVFKNSAEFLAHHDPDTAMKNRIKACFCRTWQTIAGDIVDSLKEQAKCGDREAKRVLRKGELTPNEMYELAIDHLFSYHGDEEAYKVWLTWHNPKPFDKQQFEKSRKEIIELLGPHNYGF